MLSRSPSHAACTFWTVLHVSRHNMELKYFECDMSWNLVERLGKFKTWTQTKTLAPTTQS